MKRLTVSATGLIKNQRIVCKGEMKRVVLVKGSKWDVTNTMKDQLDVVSHEMCSEFYHRQCTSPESREWRSPPSTWEHSIFKKAAPPSFSRESKLIESISDWDMGKLFMMMEKRASASLGWIFFIFVFKSKGKRI